MWSTWKKNTDCVFAKCGIKSKGLSPCFWKPQFAVLPCGSVFLAGERNGKWREGRVTLKIRVEVKAACSKRSDSGERCEVKIVPHYLNAWNRLRSKKRSGLKAFGSVYGEKLKVREIGILVCVFARKWNEFIFRKSFVSVFVAYELVFCAFVPVLSKVYSIVSLFGVESRLVYIPFQRWWGKQKEKR